MLPISLMGEAIFEISNMIQMILLNTATLTMYCIAGVQFLSLIIAVIAIVQLLRRKISLTLLNTLYWLVIPILTYFGATEYLYVKNATLLKQRITDDWTFQNKNNQTIELSLDPNTKTYSVNINNTVSKGFTSEFKEEFDPETMEFYHAMYLLNFPNESKNGETAIMISIKGIEKPKLHPGDQEPIEMK